MRHLLTASSLAAALGLTACVSDTPAPPPRPATSTVPAAAAKTPTEKPKPAAKPATFRDRVVTIARTPGQAPPPAATMARAAEAARSEAPARPAAVEPDLAPATKAAEDEGESIREAIEEARTERDQVQAAGPIDPKTAPTSPPQAMPPKTDARPSTTRSRKAGRLSTAR